MIWFCSTHGTVAGLRLKYQDLNIKWGCNNIIDIAEGLPWYKKVQSSWAYDSFK